MHPLVVFFLVFGALSALVLFAALVLDLKRERHARDPRSPGSMRRVEALRERSRTIALANESAGRGSPLSDENVWNSTLRLEANGSHLVLPEIPRGSTPGLAPLVRAEREYAEVIGRVRRSSERVIENPGAGRAEDLHAWGDTVPLDPDLTTIASVHPMTLRPLERDE